MGVILRPDDLTVGRHVCVHSYVPPRPSDPATGPSITRTYKVEPGTPLAIVTLTLPFVICSALLPSGAERGFITIDLRETNLMALAPRFMTNIVRAYRRQVSQLRPPLDATLIPLADIRPELGGLGPTHQPAPEGPNDDPLDPAPSA